MSKEITEYVESPNSVKMDLMTRTVSYEIRSKTEDININLKLRYSLCNNVEEKNILTLKELNKTKKKLEKYTGWIAEVIDVLINDDPFYEKASKNDVLIRNFIMGVIGDSGLSEIDEEDLEFFDELINTNRAGLSIFYNFIEAYVLATKYKMLKDFGDYNDDTTKTKNINTKVSSSSLVWVGTQTELIELIKSLIENGNIKGTQKDIIEKFTSFFNIEIKRPDKLIYDLKTRNNGSETLFLDKLKTSLLT